MTSEKQKNAGFLLPDPITGYDLLCVSLKIPNHYHYRAAFRGVLKKLTEWWVWEKSYQPGDTRASQAAFYWRDLIEETLVIGKCVNPKPCPDCPEPEPCGCGDCEDWIEDEIGIDLEELEMLLDCYKHSVGDITMSAVSTKAGGWLLCDGTMYEKTQYPDLALALVGLTEADETLFAVPDLRLRSPMGVGEGLDALAAAGESEHTLTTAEMPAHSHSAGSHTHEVGGHTHPSTPHTHELLPNPHGHAYPDVTILTKSNSTPGTNSRLMRGSLTGTDSSLTLDMPNVSPELTGMGDADAGVLANTPFNTGAASGTSGSAGSGAAHNNVHPVLGVHFFIFAGCAVSGEDCP
jgi:microcystin-dependent protein